MPRQDRHGPEKVPQSRSKPSRRASDAAQRPNVRPTTGSLTQNVPMGAVEGKGWGRGPAYRALVMEGVRGIRFVTRRFSGVRVSGSMTSPVAMSITPLSLIFRTTFARDMLPSVRASSSAASKSEADTLSVMVYVCTASVALAKKSLGEILFLSGRGSTKRRSPPPSPARRISPRACPSLMARPSARSHRRCITCASSTTSFEMSSRFA